MPELFSVLGRYSVTREETIEVKADSEASAHKLAKAVFSKKGKILETKIVETTDADEAA